MDIMDIVRNAINLWGEMRTAEKPPTVGTALRVISTLTLVEAI